MIAFESGLLAIGGLLTMSHKLGAPHQHRGVLLGAAAGILFGVSDVAIKALTGSVGDAGALGILSPWLAPLRRSPRSSPSTRPRAGSRRATRSR